MVTIAIMGVLAAMAIVIPRAAFRNANLNRATFDLILRLGSIRTQALREQQTYALVVVDSPDPANCTWNNPQSCVQYFILQPQPGAWTLGAFNRTNPGNNAVVSAAYVMPKGVRFHTPDPASAVPAPFNGIGFYGALTADCGQRCFAVLFTPTGRVLGATPGGGAPNAGPGYAFALATDLVGQSGAADRKGIFITFPAGIARAFPTF